MLLLRAMGLLLFTSLLDFSYCSLTCAESLDFVQTTLIAFDWFNSSEGDIFNLKRSSTSYVNMNEIVYGVFSTLQLAQTHTLYVVTIVKSLCLPLACNLVQVLGFCAYYGLV